METLRVDPDDGHLADDGVILHNTDEGYALMGDDGAFDDGYRLKPLTWRQRAEIAVRIAWFVVLWCWDGLRRLSRAVANLVVR